MGVSRFRSMVPQPQARTTGTRHTELPKKACCWVVCCCFSKQVSAGCGQWLLQQSRLPRDPQLWHVFGGCFGSGKPDADWSSPLLALLTTPA